MANDFYTPSGAPATSSQGSSATIRAEFALIEDGFDLQPTVTGNGDLPVFVNTGGTAMEAISATSARTKLGVAIGVDVQAYDANLPTWPASVDATEVSYLDGVTSAIQTQFGTKAPLASPGLTGTPTAPTAASGTSTTQIATTAFVQSEAASTNPNLIVNPDFVVNQEDYDADGVAVLVVSEYGHDMWRATGTDGEVIYKKESDGDITIKSLENTGAVSTRQVGLRYEGEELTDAVGETVTVSLYVEAIDASTNVRLTGLTTETVTTTGWVEFSGIPTSDPKLDIYRNVPISTTDTDEFRFHSLKVERGSVRTKWQKPEPVAEANKCYRYYLRIGSLTGSSMILGSGFAKSTTLIDILVVTPVEMRETTSPYKLTASIVGSNFDGDPGNIPIASVDSTGYIQRTGVKVIFQTSSTFTSSNWYSITNSNIGEYLELDARY